MKMQYIASLLIVSLWAQFSSAKDTQLSVQYPTNGQTVQVYVNAQYKVFRIQNLAALGVGSLELVDGSARSRIKSSCQQMREFLEPSSDINSRVPQWQSVTFRLTLFEDYINDAAFLKALRSAAAKKGIEADAFTFGESLVIRSLQMRTDVEGPSLLSVLRSVDLQKAEMSQQSKGVSAQVVKNFKNGSALIELQHSFLICDLINGHAKFSFDIAVTGGEASGRAPVLDDKMIEAIADDLGPVAARANRLSKQCQERKIFFAGAVGATLQNVGRIEIGQLDPRSFLDFFSEVFDESNCKAKIPTSDQRQGMLESLGRESQLLGSDFNLQFHKIGVAQ